MATTTMTVASSAPNGACIGQDVTFTACVSGQYGGTPSGSVDFFDASTDTDIGIAALDGGGTTSVSTADLGVGDHDITVTYSGDESYYPSDESTCQNIRSLLITVQTTQSSATPAPQPAASAPDKHGHRDSWTEMLNITAATSTTLFRRGRR